MTTFRVRATPLGAALQVSRRLFALGPRLTVPAVHQLMADWWMIDHMAGVEPGQDAGHPFTYALRILETPPA